MSKIKKSDKQIQIDKANVKVVLIVSIASVITAFSLVGSKALLEMQSYNSRVISQQKKALDIAKKDVVAAAELESKYNAFDQQTQNIIKGSRDGKLPQDGRNSKIVLDALPSKYDFPAFLTSLEKIFRDRGFKIDTLSGTDDVTQATTADSSNPVPIEIPVQFSVVGPYASIRDLIGVIDKSIRPIAITSLELSGSEQKINLAISAKSYYQPGKNIKVEEKVVKWSKKILQ